MDRTERTVRVQIGSWSRLTATVGDLYNCASGSRVRGSRPTAPLQRWMRRRCTWRAGRGWCVPV